MALSNLVEISNVLIEVLTQCPAPAVSMHDLPHLYEKFTGRNLDLTQLGFNSLEAFVSSMEDRLLVELDNNMNIIVSLRDTVPELGLLPVKENIIFPKLARQTISTDPDMKVVDIVLSHVHRPDKFYIQMADQIGNLEEMMDKMETFYNGEGDILKVEEMEMLRPGQLVAALWSDNCWYRARVEKIKDMTRIQLFYVDYGSLMSVDRSRMRRLDSRFLSLPGQALRSSLYGVRPPGGRRDWDRGASVRLQSLTQERDKTSVLLAQVIGGEGDKEKLKLWIFDTVVEGEVDGVHVIMKREGHITYNVDDPSFCNFLNERSVLSTVEMKVVAVHKQLRIHKMLFNLIANHNSNLTPVKAYNLEDIDNSLERESNRINSINTHLSTGSSSGISKDLDDLHLNSGVDGENNYRNYGEERNQFNGQFTAKVDSHDLVTDVNGGVKKVQVVKLDKKGVSWMVSSEISELVGEWEGRDLLSLRLEASHVTVERVVVNQRDQEGVWDMIKSSSDHVVLYRLRDLPRILTLLKVGSKEVIRSLIMLTDKLEN